jgi:glycosyltransferase involved in cell wall biosynthesis
MNPPTPSVGVLITNYNNGPWLRACVDSALAQTRSPDEIVVYDDGSNDDSVAILRSYGDRLRLIEGVHDHARSGRASHAAAAAAAFAASTADHLHLLDGDDIYYPGRIRRYEELWARAPEAVLIHSPSRSLSVDGVPLEAHHWPYKHAEDYWDHTYRVHDCNLYYPTSTHAYRRDYLERRLPLDLGDGMSFGFEVRLAAVAPLFGPVLFIPENLTYWRTRPESLWQKHRATPYLNQMLMRLRYYNRWAHAKGARPLLFWHNHLFLTACARAYGPNGLRVAVRRLLSRNHPATA